jgi:hypothetical protein
MTLESTSERDFALKKKRYQRIKAGMFFLFAGVCFPLALAYFILDCNNISDEIVVDIRIFLISFVFLYNFSAFLVHFTYFIQRR